jgi:hypothetical protein
MDIYFQWGEGGAWRAGQTSGALFCNLNDYSSWAFINAGAYYWFQMEQIGCWYTLLSYAVSFYVEI